MLRINLLPWRAIKYERAKKQYLFCLTGVVAAAVLIILVWHSYLGYYTKLANKHIASLTGKLQSLQLQVQKNKVFEQHYNEILNSMEIIKDLHANQYKVAYFFNHFPKLIPNGIRLRSLHYRTDEVELIGDARSNEFIVELIDRIKKTNWLVDPHLEILSRQKGEAITFQIKSKINVSDNSQQEKESNEIAT